MAGEQLQASDRAPRQSWPWGQWVAPVQWVALGLCEQTHNLFPAKKLGKLQTATISIKKLKGSIVKPKLIQWSLQKINRHWI